MNCTAIRCLALISLGLVEHRYSINAGDAAAQTPLTAAPEYPADRATDALGWTEVSDTYRAPLKATRAIVELYLRWAPGARVEWSSVALVETVAPAPRTARLATVHFRPQGKKTAAENC